MLLMDGGTKSFHPFTSKEVTLKMHSVENHREGGKEGGKKRGLGTQRENRDS